MQKTKSNQAEELYEHWKTWAENQNISLDKLRVWASMPDPIFHCLFCGEHWPLSRVPRLYLSRGPIFCHRCREYKGIEPCASGHCDWGENEQTAENVSDDRKL